MILITGSNGKIGKALIKVLSKKNIKFIGTQRSSKYKKINNNLIQLNLLNENHIKKIFTNHRITHLVHLAVTRNPLYIKAIRDFSTLKKDTEIIFKILKYTSKLKSIVYTSSGAVYSIIEKNYKSNREDIATVILRFLKKSIKPKLSFKTISNTKLKDININPISHKNYNKRLNGSSKLINELIFISYCLEKRIPLYILRPFYVIESPEEIEAMNHKINQAKLKYKNV